MASDPAPFRFQTRIRFVDTDASGRIHYTAMFRHFEAAEQEFLRSMGCAYSEPEFAAFGFPRVHVECDFLSEIRFDWLVDVGVSVERVGSSSFTLSFTASVESRLAAKGRITVVCTDRQTGRSCPIPERMASELRARLA